MHIIVVGRRNPCVGAFDCVFRDAWEKFGVVESVVAIVAAIVVLGLVWLCNSKKDFKARIKAEILAFTGMILSVATVMTVYSPIKQYDHLKGFYTDWLRKEEQARFALEREMQKYSNFRPKIEEIDKKLIVVQEAVKEVQKKQDELYSEVIKIRLR